jgi:hypothetical protein
MGLTATKYGVSASFYHKLSFFGKLEPLDFEPNFQFFKNSLKTYILDHYI